MQNLYPLNKIILVEYREYGNPTVYESFNPTCKWAAYPLNKNYEPFKTYVTLEGVEFEFFYGLISSLQRYEIIFDKYRPYQIYTQFSYLGPYARLPE